MSTLELPSAAERYADKAAQYSAFSGLSLAKVRREMSELLGLIRANGIFEEYTKHDISHIDRMLSQLDWLIPAETQSIMTAADWLLIVLATYFHDLGMVVTRDEYSQRYSTPFSAFRDKVMGSKETIIKDYAARVEDLPPDEAERFLYQEYVRDNHSRRIRAWIDIQENPQVGITKAMAEEVKRILGPLEPVFREDLAIICESHHLDDLENTAKYPVSRPYGPNAQEAANVQYAAVLLRTIDLLDITSDRAPSISFRIINPRDLVSQREWAKHSAVRSVRPKIAEDDEGNLDPALPQDTIEVHARYENAEGFFGLTSYLLYAEGQIRLSHDWVSTANRRMGSQYQFPWRSIDSSNIETKGFLDRPFEFTLDQDKILELLTGHTLYNDTGVVLRELLQNSIDAVRLAHGDDAESNGSIQVRWNSDKRILEVRDNGTGMTQDIIERHFLRVGASYYQDSQFQKRNPGFNAISRFGIGVLSTFMVADHVEVVTCHLDEPDARKLELRTVHGKYLIRLLDKNQDEEAAEIGPSGTMVRLHVRPSAVINDIVQLGRKWIVVPRCPVTIAVDGRKPETIGHKSVKAALEQALAYSDWVDSGDDMLKIRIVERQKDGVSLAYALRWSDYFKEWNFIQLFDEPEDDREPRYILGTCVEGVRVEADPPGFTQASRANIAAIANVVGPGAPRTNVARSSFEQTDEYRQCLRQIYLLYAAHITEELGEIQTQRRQSLTWAASEGQYLAMALMRSGEATSNEELMSAFETIPMFLLEQDGQRLGVSANGLTEGNSFWTVEGALHEHIEYLLREIPESMRSIQNPIFLCRNQFPQALPPSRYIRVTPAYGAPN